MAPEIATQFHYPYYDCLFSIFQVPEPLHFLVHSLPLTTRFEFTTGQSFSNWFGTACQKWLRLFARLASWLVGDQFQSSVSLVYTLGINCLYIFSVVSQKTNCEMESYIQQVYLSVLLATPVRKVRTGRSWTTMELYKSSACPMGDLRHWDGCS